MTQPPINIVTDAILLAVKCSGIVIAARQNITTYEDLKKTVEYVKSANANILGVVVTDAHDKNTGYGKGKYAYQYKYGYGNESEME